MTACGVVLPARMDALPSWRSIHPAGISLREVRVRTPLPGGENRKTMGLREYNEG